VTLSVKQFSIGAAAYQKLLEAAAKAERRSQCSYPEGLAYVHIWPHNAARPALKALAKKYGIAAPGN